MGKSTVVELRDPVATDPLTELLRNGASKLIHNAVEAELFELLEHYKHVKTLEGKQAIVRNGYLPDRTIQTGIGDVSVKMPKIRDRTGSGIKFNSSLLPPYLRRTRSIEELLPWLYLKGVSTGDFQEALTCLLGKDAPGLSQGVVSRLKRKWEDEHSNWCKRDLSKRRYVYFWVDGVYFNVRSEDGKQCILVIIGATDTGHKEPVAICDGYRESEESWLEILRDLKRRGLRTPPELAVGDGALGFWKALRKLYPETRQQRCWVHKTSNVLNKLPKGMQQKAKGRLHDIYLAETREAAYKAFDAFIEDYSLKHPKAAACLEKDKQELLAFYDFPAEQWAHLRTTNPVESAFATVRLRTAKTRGCVSRNTILALVYRLMMSASKRWRRLRGYKQIAKVIEGVEFKNGIEVDDRDSKNAA